MTSYHQQSTACAEAIPILWALGEQLVLQERLVEALLCLEALLPNEARQCSIQLQLLPIQEAKIRLRIGELLFRLGRRSNARAIKRHIEQGLLLVKIPAGAPSLVYTHDGYGVSSAQREVVETRLRLLCLYASLPGACESDNDVLAFHLKLLAQASDLAVRYSTMHHAPRTIHITPTLIACVLIDQPGWWIGRYYLWNWYVHTQMRQAHMYAGVGTQQAFGAAMAILKETDRQVSALQQSDAATAASADNIIGSGNSNYAIVRV
jgi:hypothetical protein